MSLNNCQRVVVGEWLPWLEEYFEELRLEAATRQAQRESLEARARALLTLTLCTLVDSAFCRWRQRAEIRKMGELDVT